MVRITIDETVPLARMEHALRGLPYSLALTTNRGRVIQPGSRRPSLYTLPLPRVVGKRETRFLEAVLAVLGGGERQRRAARCLYAHTQDNRGIYVTDDSGVFGARGDERRRRLSALTKVMTLEEFEEFCDDRRNT
jgi:hypothetical protein